MTESGTALIIDPEVDSRMSLKTSLRSMEHFDTIRIAGSPDDRGLSETALTTYDVIFVSLSFSQERLIQLLALVKNSPLDRGTGIILLAQKQPPLDLLTRLYIEGADGFLLYPYSGEKLEEAIVLCEQLREKRKAERIQNALYLLVKEMKNQVTYVASLQKSGKNANTSKRMLQEMCSVLAELDEQALEIYYEIVLDVLPALPPPGVPDDTRDNYRGNSERVRFLEGNQRLAEVRRLMVA